MAERATLRTPEIETRIIEGLCDGVPLRELCRQEGMPNWRTVYDWISADEELAARIAHARDLGFDAIAEDILRNVDGVKAISEHIQRSKLQVETRLKLLAKWSPKKYGDKQQVEVGNKDGEALEIKSTADNAALALHVAAALRIAGTKVPEQ